MAYVHVTEEGIRIDGQTKGIDIAGAKSTIARLENAIALLEAEETEEYVRPLGDYSDE